MKIHPVFHISLLKPVIEQDPQFKSRKEEPPEPIEIDGYLEDEVEEILDKRIRKFGRGQQVSYLVKWTGYESIHNSWVPLKNMNNCKELIDEYEARAKVGENDN
jgi:hypothetical protein